jgi:hypothetical protein
VRQALRGVVVAALATACGSTGEPPPDPNGVLPPTQAERNALGAHCENPDPSRTHSDVDMMPGRRCLHCHGAGGMAARLQKFTAAGTVFSTPTPPACDPGGPSGVLVELLAADGSVQASTTTWNRGNFFVKGALAFPLGVRLTVDGRTVTKKTAVSTGDCASCHDGVTTGRIASP